MNRLGLFCALLAFTGCIDNPIESLPDANSDTQADNGKADLPDGGRSFRGLAERIPAQTGISPDGLSVTGTEATGRARGGRVLSPETGFTGIWAHCKEGDFKLINAKIEACIQNEVSNRYETFSGGSLSDIKLAGTDHEDILDVVLPRIELNVFHADRVYLVRDGSDGGPAVIRADGTDTPIAHFVGVLGPQVFESKELVMSVEYRLFPDASDVEIVVFTGNESERAKNIQVGDLVGFGDRTRKWKEGEGHNVPSYRSFDWLAAYSDEQALGWVKVDGVTTTQLPIPLGDVPWILTQNPTVEIPPGGENVSLSRFLVGEPSMELMRRRIKSELGIEVPTPFEIKVVDASGPVANRWMTVETMEGEVARVRTNDLGTTSVAIANGEYTVVVDPEMGEPEQSSIVTADGSDKEIQIAETGTLSMEVFEVGRRVSGTVRVVGDSFSTAMPAPSTTGATVRLAPGTYEVYAERGMEYSVAQQTVTITAGEQSNAMFNIERLVDTTDWIAGDFHQHLEPSIDSSIHIEDRVRDNVAQGVEFVVPTDHEVVSDLGPYIERLDLGSEIATMPGVEISPAITHMNVYPMVYKPELRGRGSIPLAIRTDDGVSIRRQIPEIIEIARNLEDPPIIQINHARGSSGMFDTVDFDPSTDPRVLQDARYALDFDTMEVMNDFSDICSLYTDWASFLNVGLRRTAMANSDSHSIWTNSGYPRTYMHIPGVAPGDVTQQMVRDALGAGRATLSANAMITFGNDLLPGDVIASSPGADVSIDVVVQTPAFARADKMFVIANGEIVDEIELLFGTEAIVDYQDTYTRAFPTDAWVSFVVVGPRISGAVHNNRRVFAMTNAVYVDVDGDADGDNDAFEAPGPKVMDLLPIDTFDMCN